MYRIDKKKVPKFLWNEKYIVLQIVSYFYFFLYDCTSVFKRSSRGVLKTLHIYPLFSSKFILIDTLKWSFFIFIKIFNVYEKTIKKLHKMIYTKSRQNRLCLFLRNLKNNYYKILKIIPNMCFCKKIIIQFWSVYIKIKDF